MYGRMYARIRSVGQGGPMSVWEFLWWLSFWVCAAVALWDFIFRPWWRERIRRALDEDFGRPKPSEEGRPPGEG